MRGNNSVLERLLTVCGGRLLVSFSQQKQNWGEGKKGLVKAGT